YYIEHGGEQQLSIVLNNTGLPGNMPVSLENSFIAALNNQENNSNTICTITLLPGTKIDDLQLIDQPQPLLRLVLSNPQLTKSSMLKQPAALSPGQQILKQYQEIQQQLLTKEKPEIIIRNLRLFLGDHPDHLEAQSLLVSLLIKIGQLQKADSALMLGLDKNKNYIPFIKLKAYILIKQQNANEAITLLKKHLVNINDTEYVSLLASLYQKQGQFIQAAGLYSRLTKAQPEKTVWWLGLGIALESADKNNAAREAYIHAYNTSDVPQELKQFLNNKLKN
ncbi:MAG: hypothetical protein KAI17_27165, partial [Thiotrichaceae bacterium]|nr:hypothetical protein [Thiotrichaceae bacterium]